MRERDILTADPATLDEDDLDELIGASTRIMKRLGHDKSSTTELRKQITARQKALKDARTAARAERRGR